MPTGRVVRCKPNSSPDAHTSVPRTASSPSTAGRRLATAPRLTSHERSQEHRGDCEW
jgi:hypothetical protein